MTTVGELLEVLARLPAGLRVVVDGYEGGFADPVLDAEVVVEREPGDEAAAWLGDLRAVGRDEAGGDVALVVGRGRDGGWLTRETEEKAGVLAALRE